MMRVRTVSGSSWTRLFSLMFLGLSYATIAAYVTLFIVAPGAVGGQWVYWLVAFELGRLSLSGRQDPLKISLAVVFILLFALAGPGIYWLQGRETTRYVILMILFKDLFYALNRGSYDRAIGIRTNLDRKIRPSGLAVTGLLALALASNVVASSGVMSKLGFIVPYALSLVLLERVLRDPSTRISRVAVLLGLYFTAIAIYIVFFWSGFGRIRIGSYILMPLLLVNFYRDIKIRIWQVALAAPVLIFVAQASRYGDVASAERFFLGSAGVHITFSDDLWGGDIHELYGGFQAWLDQYLLLLGNWLPSALWPDKPVGLGLSSVDDWIGRKGFGQGYSISIGFIGEQYYLLGERFWLGLAVALATLVVLRRGVGLLCRGYVAPLIMFDVNLMSYIWGGGATFGSRLFFFLVPTVAFIFVIDRFNAASALPPQVRKPRAST